MKIKNIDRRNFIRQAGLGSLAIGFPISTIKNVPGTYRDVLVEKCIVKGKEASNRPNILSSKSESATYRLAFQR